MSQRLGLLMSCALSKAGLFVGPTMNHYVKLFPVEPLAIAGLSPCLQCDPRERFSRRELSIICIF